MQDVFVDSQSGVAYRKRKKKYNFAGFILSFLMMTLILWGVISLDFVLFVQSGGASLFDGGFLLKPEITVILVGILAFAAGIMLLTCFSRSLQAFFIALFGCVIAWAMMSQFLLPDKTTFLSLLLMPYLGAQAAYLSGYSHYLAAFVAFFAVYWLLSSKTNGRPLLFLALLLLVMFGVLARNHIQGKNDSIFSETFAEHSFDKQASSGKIVYLLLPNMASFPSIGDADEKDINKNSALKNIMQGFLFKNNFKVYQNAYVTDNNPFVNAAQILNFLDEKPLKSRLMPENTDDLWNFSRLNRVSVRLKDNQFADSFKKAGYQVSAYQSRGIDICGKTGKQEADRCVYKSDYPVYPADVRSSQKTFLLLGQWLASMDLFNLPMAESYLNFALDAQQSALLKLPYEKMYVLNSEKVLDKLLNDLQQDEGANVYVAYVDLPSDLLIYNEYCQLKPTMQWSSQTAENAGAKAVRDYNEQMMCTLGFLQNFILKADADNVTLVVAGVGGRMSQAAKPDKTLDFSEIFRDKNSVFLAIREPNGRFVLNRQICSVPALLRNYLLNTEGCQEFSGFHINDVLKTKTSNYLSEHTISPDDFKTAGEAFDIWFDQWKKVNNDVPKQEFFYNPIPESSVKTNDYDIIVHAGKAISDKFSGKQNVIENRSDAAVLVPAASVEPETVVEEPRIQETGEAVAAEKQTTVEEPQKDESQVVNKKEEKTNINKDEVEVKEEQNKEEVKKSETAEDNADIPLEIVTVPVPEAKPAVPVLSEKTSEPEVKVLEKAQKKQSLPETQNIKEDVQKSKQVQSEATAKKIPEVVVIRPKKTIKQENNKSQDDKPAVSGDFLLEDSEEWELDPAKALGLDPSEDTQERIVVKVK